MRRGDIYLADLEPAKGSEADKRRPVVVVSNDGVNSSVSTRRRGVVTVVPVTSNLTHVFPFQVLLPADDVGLSRDSKAQAEQVRSVSADRLSTLLGSLTPALMQQLDDALRLHLSL